MNEPTIAGKRDRVTGKPATIYTPPEDLVEPLTCPSCGNYRDTPNHELGCEMGRQPAPDDRLSTYAEAMVTTQLNDGETFEKQWAAADAEEREDVFRIARAAIALADREQATLLARIADLEGALKASRAISADLLQELADERAIRARVRGLALEWDARADGSADEYPREARVWATDARELLALLDGPACTCPLTPPEEWVTYRSAIEPGSRQEFNPECPMHRLAGHCSCPPCPGRGNDGHGMTHCAECCFGSGVVADEDCPVHGRAALAGPAKAEAGEES